MVDPGKAEDALDLSALRDHCVQLLVLFSGPEGLDEQADADESMKLTSVRSTMTAPFEPTSARRRFSSRGIVLRSSSPERATTDTPLPSASTYTASRWPLPFVMPSPLMSPPLMSLPFGGAERPR
jgi:hypothetical protein